MGDTTDIKKGAVIRHNNDLYVVKDFQFVNPGKGTAFTKTKMKGIGSGKTIEITYKSGESLDTVEVYRKTMQFLYAGEDNFSFMNKETYETIEVDAEVIGAESKYLKEGMDVIMALHEDHAVAMDLPKKLSYTVKVAPDAVKGDSQSGNVTKMIELENGLVVHAPIFIKEGEVIEVYTDDATYAGRVAS
jgi:elongation factor P